MFSNVIFGKRHLIFSGLFVPTALIMINVLFAYFLLECLNNFSQIQVACHEIPQRTNEKNKTFMGKVGSKSSILKPYILNWKLTGTHMVVTLFP